MGKKHKTEEEVRKQENKDYRKTDLEQFYFLKMNDL